MSVWTRDVERPMPLRTVRLPVLSGTVRRCASCERVLPVEFFSRSRACGRQHWCKECFAAYFRARKDKHRAMVAESKRARCERARGFLRAYLDERACVDCGELATGTLEFDHVRSPKRANVTDLVTRGASEARLRREIELCEVVCVNCHRRRTARRATSWRLDEGPRRSDRPGRDRNQAFVRSILEQSACVDCGAADLEVLEFDHVGPKRFSISLAISHEYALERLAAEIANCEVRCANCHRLRTAERARHFRASSVAPP